MEKEESEKEDEGGIRLADLLTRFTSETSSSSSLASEARAISLLNRDVCPPVFVLGSDDFEEVKRGRFEEGLCGQSNSSEGNHQHQCGIK
uniref:Uncharacterized protein n=1 Tax=Vespula pensylvanica TaxID=30213 RepID=A0A834PGG8_VESPE|nr:hypothetical protein H0235_001486 [Vespula pensylvanica]